MFSRGPFTRRIHIVFSHTMLMSLYGIFLTIVIFDRDKCLIDVNSESVGWDLVPVDVRDP